jgi:hypothetical protein
MLKMKTHNHKKFSKYLLLLKLLEKNCKGNCKDNFQKLISYLDEDTLKFIAECIRNVLSPQVIKRLSKKQQNQIISKVSPHRKAVKQIIKKGLPFKKRKKYIQEGGAWFLPLLSSIIPMVSSLFSPKS